ncbi:hypothetical protein CY34DRAFT_734881 [Suillus luteus UH-Slu-Lm8-n1]|uniref:ATPase AAA-type core domain-containing protein n=1 Tax=Suillus luteus UH-Slu-Lm8-n1 TaxID=930992 RepID=A0A0D0BR79_9AGAM|nr:hypothetical protein CY34DRAFT_734881 [Suillus luteus UH-Slu-Lm8-n1]
MFVIGVPFGRGPGTVVDHISSSLFIDHVSCSPIYRPLFLDSCWCSVVFCSLSRGSCSTRPHSTGPHFGLIYTLHGFLDTDINPFPSAHHLPQSDMFFPPPIKGHLPKLPFENMEELGLERLSWITGYDIEKHEWVTVKGLDCDASSYDQDAWSKLVKDQQTKDLIQSILDTIGCSPSGQRPEHAQQGVNILLKGALGTGKNTVARAICNIFKRPMFDIRVNDIPSLGDVQPWASKVASLAIQWNAVVVVDRGDYFIKSKSPVNQERINTVIKEFESPGCICLWPSVFAGEHQIITRQFSATINFPDLDLAARRRRWLHLFGRDDLAATLSSSEHASAATVKDREAWTFIREIEKISWYELDGADIENFMNLARSLADVA